MTQCLTSCLKQYIFCRQCLVYELSKVITEEEDPRIKCSVILMIRSDCCVCIIYRILYNTTFIYVKYTNSSSVSVRDFLPPYSKLYSISVCFLPPSIATILPPMHPFFPPSFLSPSSTYADSIFLPLCPFLISTFLLPFLFHS